MDNDGGNNTLKKIIKSPHEKLMPGPLDDICIMYWKSTLTVMEKRSLRCSCVYCAYKFWFAKISQNHAGYSQQNMVYSNLALS